MRLFRDGDEIWIEPWRAHAFPVIMDRCVDRSAVDRVIAAGGYITATGAGAAGTTGVLAALDRAKDFVLANGQAFAAVGAAAGVAGVATVAVVLAGSGSHTPTASPPGPVRSAPLPGTSTNAPAPHQVPEPGHTAQPGQRTQAPPAPTTVPPTAVLEPLANPVQHQPAPHKPAPHKPATTPHVPKGTVASPAGPAPQSADVAVRLTFSLRVGALTRESDGLLGYLNVNTSGIPAAQHATVTVRVTGGRLVQRGSGCQPTGSVATCSVGPGAPALQFNVMGVPVSASATITGPAGWTDPAPANNNDSVLLGVLRLGSLRG
jgi:hypothetical protein